MDLENSVVKRFIEENSKNINSNPDSGKKFQSLRKQAFALQELTKSLPETSKTTIFRAFFEEHPSNDVGFLSHIEQCSKAVNTMLASHPRQAQPLKISAQAFLEENNINLEPGCSGKYESCSKKEVNESDLRAFLKQTDKTDEIEEVIDTPPRKIVRSDSNPMPWGSANRLPASNPVSPKRQPTEAKFSGFRTAREEFVLQSMKKNVDPSNSTSGHPHGSNTNTLFNYGAVKKSLGARRNVRAPFVPPVRQEENGSTKCTPPNSNDDPIPEPEHERLRNIDPKMVALITNEIMHKFKPIDWNDIAGLEYAKSTIKEAVVWPLLRPDIFTGIRRPPRGILLFGPPGTGKTLIGKCIASQSRSTFFSISASSLTSKWIGDGEKMVRALFAVAAVNQPSVVFIDEIDSLLSQRSENEHESTRRLKTEFLVQLDGATTSDDDRILIVGATNRPQELDEAARRRLVRRLYIPLPEMDARVQILNNLLKTVRNTITSDEIIEIGNLTGGYSGADMETLCREASMEPIRSIPPDEIPFFSEANVRPVQLNDFQLALKRVRASVSDKDLKIYSDWNRIYGAGH